MRFSVIVLPFLFALNDVSMLRLWTFKKSHPLCATLFLTDNIGLYQVFLYYMTEPSNRIVLILKT
jgi:hypothetical protein